MFLAGDQRFASARSSFFDSLPTSVFGSSSRNSISAGSSILESFSFRKWMQLGRASPLAVLQLDEGLRRLAAIGVGNADHRHLGDGRMLVERVLDPPRIDLEARGD